MQTPKSEYQIIGVMSGTSLDGLDIAQCIFKKIDNIWSYKINHSETINYTKKQQLKLSNALHFTALELKFLDVKLGEFIGKKVKEFIKRNNLSCDFVSSHGHTIFHQPKQKITMQIGSGASIAAECNLPVICDFRSLDVALEGNGAPLVPIGDRLLFSEYKYRLNLGGIANVSYEDEDNTIAHDVCVCNILLNHYAKKLEADYDKNGDFAREGEIIYPLLENLNRLDFYQNNSPKSLGIEWVKENIFPFTEMYKDEPKNILTTAVFHIAKQIAETINGNEKPEKVLITGGGAFNSFLVETLKTMTHHEIIIPEPQIVNYKEALIFAFLGLLRWENTVNCLSSVTGAKKDNIGGAIYYNK